MNRFVSLKNFLYWFTLEFGNQNPIALEGLANAYQQTQAQFDNAQEQVTGLRNELAATQNELAATQGNLFAAQSSRGMGLKSKKPESFTGKGSVHSWITHVTNYIGNGQYPQAFSVAISYLESPAHEWWIAYKETEKGQKINTWPLLK